MLGVIFSYQNTPSIGKIYFQIEKDVEVNRGQFVSINHPLGKCIGVIVDVFRLNPYYDNPNTEFKFEEHLPINDWHSSIAEVKPLGILDSNLKFKKLTYPPYAGSVVDVPQSLELKSFLGLKDSGLNLGFIENPTTNVNLDLSKLIQKHLAILAMSGAGKSVCTSVIIEELLSYENSPAIVLFDVHGEYRNFSENTKKVNYFNEQDITFSLNSISESLFSRFIGRITPAQYRALFNSIRGVKNDEQYSFDISDLKQKVSEISDSKTKDILMSNLDQIERTGLFERVGKFSIDNIELGKLNIFDLSKFTNMNAKHIIVAYIATKLFELRLNNQGAPFLLILEEAHQFVPEQTSDESAKAKSILETIAREGRKFGSSLCLISQRPISLHTNILSQCSTQILLRITNPYDLDHIKKSCENLDSKSVDMINTLNVGEALIVGNAVNYPLFFKVRDKHTASKYDSNLEEMILEHKKNILDKKKLDDSFTDLYI